MVIFYPTSYFSASLSLLTITQARLQSYYPIHGVVLDGLSQEESIIPMSFFFQLLLTGAPSKAMQEDLQILEGQGRRVLLFFCQSS